MNEKKALIVGAGLSGATVARSLADNGYKVTVWEREKYVGGTVADYPHDGYFVQRHGPHLFHTNSETAYAFLSRFTEWFDFRHCVRAKVDGKYIPVPFNFTSLEMLMGKEKAAKIEEKLIEAYGPDKAVSISELRASEDKQIKEFAEFVYETVFKYYSFKQWGLDMAAIDPSVFKRVPVRTGRIDGYFSDKYQLMPVRGFSAIIENMLKHENITVETGKDALSLLKAEGNILTLNGKKADCPVVYSGCIDELFGLKFGALPYRTLRFDFRTEQCESFQPYAVVNYTVDEDFTRISEYKKFTAQNVASKTSVTVREYPMRFERGSGLSPYYPMPTAAAKECYLRYADLSVENLYFAGRLGRYVYINMDRAVDDALALAEKILKENGR